MICVNRKLDSGVMAYTEDEMTALRDKQISLFELIFENSDYGFFNTHLADSLIFRGFAETGGFTIGDSNNDAMLLLKAFDSNEFAFIRQNDEFKYIKEYLSQYARKWYTE